MDLFQGLGLVLEQVFVVLTQHTGARTGRYNYRVIFGKQGQLRAGDFPSLLGVTRGVGRLAAAALALGVIDFNAFTFNQVNRVHPGLGKEQVYDTGAEQVNLARFMRGVLAWHRH